MAFLHYSILLLILLIPIFWLKFRRNYYLSFSQTKIQGKSRSSTILQKLPLAIFSLGLALSLIALARPQQSHDAGTETIKTRAIIISLDKSGSMGTSIAGNIPVEKEQITELDQDADNVIKILEAKKENPNDTIDAYGNRGYLKRIDAANLAIKRFVRQRYLAKQDDRIAIMSFDTEPYWSWPLTEDLKQIYRKRLFLDQGFGGGTNFGNSYPGPIDAAIEHFDERSKEATRVLIMVTDGEDYINPETMDRLVTGMNKRNIHFYVIGVGETLARYDVDIFRLARAVGGQIFRVENAGDLARCLDIINSLERTEINILNHIGFHDIFVPFALAAFLIFLLSAVAEALIISR